MANISIPFICVRASDVRWIKKISKTNKHFEEQTLQKVITGYFIYLWTCIYRRSVNFTH